MPLQRQDVEIPLNGGLDVKQSDELQSVNTLTTISNLRYRKGGRLEKRSTYHATTGTFDATDEIIDTVFANQGRVVALGRTQGCGTLQGSTLELPGDVDPPLKPVACRVSRLVAAQVQESTGSYGIISTASAAVNGQIITAHSIATGASTNDVIVRVFDASTSELIAMTTVSVSSLSSLVFVQVCPITSQNGAIIAWSRGTALPFTIEGLKYDTATRTFGSLTTIVSANAAGGVFSMCESTTTTVSGGGYYLAYSDDTAGAMLVHRRQYSNLTTILATHTASHVAGASSICDNGVDGAMIASIGSSNVYMELFGNPANVIAAGSSTAEPTAVSIGYGLEGANRRVTAIVNWTSVPLATSLPSTLVANAFNAIYATAYITAYSSSPTVLYQQRITGAYAVSHGVTIDNVPHFALVTDVGEPTETLSSASSLRSGQSGLIVRVRPGSNYYWPDVIARFGHDRASTFATMQPMSALTLYDRTLYVAHLADNAKTNTLLAFNLPQSSFVAGIRFGESDDSFPLVSAEHAGATMVASGELFDFDGQWPIETQPRGRPRCQVEYESAGSVTIATSLSFCVVYTFVDQAGRLHRSAPSQAVTITADGADTTSKTFNVYVPAAPIPAYAGFGAAGYSTYVRAYNYELYVTEDGGSTFYLALNSTGRKHAPSGSYASNTYVLFGNVQPSDGTSPQLYSDGSTNSELWSEPPPSFISICKVADRFWGVDAEDRSRIWYSKPLVPGYAVEWNTACTLVIGDQGVAVVDGNGTPTVFGERGIWVIPGDGPNANGIGSFSPAQRLPHEVEAICPTSVCKTPAGVFVRTRRGVSVLGGGYDLQPVGLPIDPLMPDVSASSIIRTVYDEHFSEVRVIDHDGGVFGNMVFVYSLPEQKWTTWAQSGTAQNMRDACVASGRVWYVHKPSSGAYQLRRELGSDETDHNLSTEAITIATPWIRLDNVAGFGRLRRITLPIRLPGEPENVAVIATLYKDFDLDNTIALQQWSPLSDLGGDGALAYAVLHPEEQRVSVVKLVLTMGGTPAWGGWAGESSAFIAGGYFVSARFELGIQPGGRRQIDSRARKG
jgi:hypothetical protein